MADDDELVIVGESNRPNRRERRKIKRARRRERRQLALQNSEGMPDSSFNISTNQQECWIIDEPKNATEDPTDLIVLDSVESEEGELVDSRRSTPNGHLHSTLSETPSVKSLREKIRFLEQENSILKYGKPKNNESVCITSPSDGPAIQVTFLDATLAQKYRSEVEKFLLEISSKEKALNAERRNHEKTQDDALPGCSFVVDKGTTEETVHIPDEWAVPVYNKDFGEVLDKSAEGETLIQKVIVVEKCFNCNGCHLIKDCPEKHDQRRINMNKRKLYGQRTPQSNKRLGNEKLWQLKYTPGNVSEALRNAMSLRAIQIPPYIYNMRVLGYPPGWLKDAEVDRSGINIYDSDGNVVQTDDKEEGEIEEIKVEYDSSKLIDYPGFNVPLSSNYIDEHLKLGCPPMKLHQQRAEVEKFLKPVTTLPYRKRKMAAHSTKKQKTSHGDKIETLDMDIDLTVQSSDDNSQGQPSFTSPIRLQVDEDSADQSQGASSQESSRVSSPMLTDIDERKICVMQDLGAESANDSDSQKPSGDCTSLEEVEIVLSTPVRNSNGSSEGYTSKSVVQGTPVLAKHSPFQKLPEADVFSVGISDHINYENLPNATGCYDKLRCVLSKVREKTKDLFD